MGKNVGHVRLSDPGDCCNKFEEHIAFTNSGEELGIQSDIQPLCDEHHVVVIVGSTSKLSLSVPGHVLISGH